VEARFRRILPAPSAAGQPALDYTSLEALGYFLGKRFWADIEAHHPGIDSLHLPRQVADDWKRRLATFSKTTLTPTGERVHVTVPRINYRECLTPVRAFYLEQDRAARSGRAAVEVLDRYVTAVPADGPAWIDQLSTLADQISTGPRPIADHHLDQLAAALELTQAAIANRTRWRCGQHRY